MELPTNGKSHYFPAVGLLQHDTTHYSSTSIITDGEAVSSNSPENISNAAESDHQRRRRKDLVNSQEIIQQSVRWSRDSLTVDQLVQLCDRKFPIIVRTTRGYHDVNGLGQLSLSVGQVSYVIILMQSLI
jgi:hypothetical protein